MPGSAESARPGIWLADLQASGAQPVEIASGADGASLPLAFSDSGKQLFFASDATNLLPGEADKNDEAPLRMYDVPGHWAAEAIAENVKVSSSPGPISPGTSRTLMAVGLVERIHS